MGLYTITTRSEGTVLTGFGSSSDIFNADHQNHVDHTAAAFVNSFEATLADMQATTDPAPAGVVSLPSALSDEIRRMRFVIAQIKQKISGAATAPFWYNPASTLSEFLTLTPVGARITSAAAQSIPSNTLTQVTFDTTVYDTGSLRLGSGYQVPADGVYIIGGTLCLGDVSLIPPPGTGFLQLRLRTISFDLSTTQDMATHTVNANTFNTAKAITLETAKFLSKGDFVILMVQQSSGTPRSTANAQIAPALWISLAGR